MKLWKTGPAVLLALAILALAGRTLVRIPEWRSTETIFSALRRDRPDAFRAQWHHARLAANAENAPLALERYAQALNTWPYRRRLTVEAANYAGFVGDTAFARRINEFALTQWPTNVDMLRLRAGLALDRGDTVAARSALGRALRHAPEDTLLLRMRDAIGTDTAANR